MSDPKEMNEHLHCPLCTKPMRVSGVYWAFRGEPGVPVDLKDTSITVHCECMTCPNMIACTIELPYSESLVTYDLPAVGYNLYAPLTAALKDMNPDIEEE